MSNMEAVEKQKELRTRIEKILKDNTQIVDETYGADNFRVTQEYFDADNATSHILSVIQELGYLPVEPVQLEVLTPERQLTKVADRIRGILDLYDRMMEMLYHADFSNGVESFGMDEGRVRAYKMMKELEKDYQSCRSTILGELEGK